MLTQQEWVGGCYTYYAENGYEPGNPEDGDWEVAHYPVPRCLGGVDTVLLLREHHAVQGVLQSEQYQHPCIWGWESNYLTGEMLILFGKWKRINAQPYIDAGHHARRSPVRITYPDGSVTITESVASAAITLGINRHRIKKILTRTNNYLHHSGGRWNAKSTGIRIEYA
jgi:hypothetical protein